MKRKLSEILDAKKKQRAEERQQDDSDRPKKKVMITEYTERGHKKSISKHDLSEKKSNQHHSIYERNIQTPSAQERKNKIQKKYS